MKILHMMLSNFYIDDYGYQENALPKQNAEDGHDVKIIASIETFIDHQKPGYTNPAKYMNRDGIEVQRLPYSKALPRFVMTKIRSYPGVYTLIEKFNPDVILFHGCAAWELLTLARYKRSHPGVRVFVDSHGDWNNSGKNFFSKWILHRMFYRWIIHRCIPYIDCLFYISLEVKDFIIQNYGISENIMEYFPLGGAVVEEGERLLKRNIKRNQMKLNDDNILFIHTGKMDRLKRTEEIVTAFSKVQNTRFRLVLLGSIHESIKPQVDLLIEADKRISFLGWKSHEELLEYLCACDMYVQPGGQSATMQNAICVSAPVMLYPYPSHAPYLKGNGYYVKGVDDLIQCFERISCDSEELKIMSQNSGRLAREILDYRKLAARLY